METRLPVRNLRRALSRCSLYVFSGLAWANGRKHVSSPLPLIIINAPSYLRASCPPSSRLATRGSLHRAIAIRKKSNLTRYKSGIRKQRGDADTFPRNLKPMTDAAGGRRRKVEEAPLSLRLFDFPLACFLRRARLSRRFPTFPRALATFPDCRMQPGRNPALFHVNPPPPRGRNGQQFGATAYVTRSAERSRWRGH